MNNDSVLIPLTRGYHTVIDVADSEAVSHFKWQYVGGYAGRQVQRSGKKYQIYLHRVLLNAPDGSPVDHINHNTLDNRRTNLRVVTQSENVAHRAGAQRNSASGVLNVHFNARKGKYEAQIQREGKRSHLGYFDDIEQARQAVAAARGD